MSSSHYETYIKPLRERYRKANWTTCTIMLPSEKLGEEANEIRRKVKAYADKLIDKSTFNKP